jgi:Rps23 Pro-64 3,4-dihydroxylase Tpa1-like proline 4-hydroxylase
MSRIMEHAFMYHTSLFTPEECEIIKKTAGESYEHSMVGNEGGLREEAQRSSNNLWFDFSLELPELYQKFWNRVQFLNNVGFGIAITGMGELTQMTLYNEGEFYRKHIDTMAGNLCVRKLSAVVQLTDPSERRRGVES